MGTGEVNLKSQCNLPKINIKNNSNYVLNITELIHVSQKVVLEIVEEMPKCNCSSFAEHHLQYKENLRFFQCGMADVSTQISVLQLIPLAQQKFSFL